MTLRDDVGSCEQIRRDGKTPDTETEGRRGSYPLNYLPYHPQTSFLLTYLPTYHYFLYLLLYHRTDYVLRVSRQGQTKGGDDVHVPVGPRQPRGPGRREGERVGRGDGATHAGPVVSAPRARHVGASGSSRRRAGPPARGRSG